MPENAIVIQGLTKSFKELEVLKGIDLAVEEGSILALLGPNGAGKTTTVRILSTLLRPDGGTVMVNGHDVVRDPDGVRESIGLTGQYAAVDDYLTGYENLVMMGRLYHLSKADSVRRANELLEIFDLTEARSRAAKTYSGGMRRRLDLALSLIAAPPIIFLDEPTTGLDPRSRLAVWDIVAKLQDAGTTVLLTTQYLDEADKLADRVAVIDHGKVIAEGTPDELKGKVGKDRLELVIAKASDFAAAARAVEREVAEKDAEERTMSIEVGDGVHDIKRILAALDEAGIEIENLSLQKPTLDDVFLKLTGHEASEESEATSTS